jgi:hypothetical protein
VVVIAVVGHQYFGALDDEGGVGKLELLRCVVTRLPAAFIEVVVELEDVSVDEGVIVVAVSVDEGAVELPDGVLTLLDDKSVDAVVAGVVVVVVVEPGAALAPLLL